jgi:hypothetical protein
VRSTDICENYGISIQKYMAPMGATTGKKKWHISFKGKNHETKQVGLWRAYEGGHIC